MPGRFTLQSTLKDPGREEKGLVAISESQARDLQRACVLVLNFPAVFLF